MLTRGLAIFVVCCQSFAEILGLAAKKVQNSVVANRLLSIQTNSPRFTCIHTKIDTTIPDISYMSFVLKCKVKRSFLRKGPTILVQREYIQIPVVLCNDTVVGPTVPPCILLLCT
jgi:hypothetical protein